MMLDGRPDPFTCRVDQVVTCDQVLFKFWSWYLVSDIYLDFISQENVGFNIYGYYINEELIAFSSEFFVHSVLYSYFIGLDYQINEKYSIYNRILYDTIYNGIDKKAKKVVYGRTAAEFKSTIGAEPIPSKSAVYISNGLLSIVFSPILKRISPANWVQRKPFKS